MSWRDTEFYKTRQKSVEVKEQKVLKALKELPKNEYGYIVAKHKEIAQKAGVPLGSLSGILEKLKEAGVIEIKRSIWLVGTLKGKAIKVLK